MIHRVALTRIRTSGHFLRIETGRYNKQNDDSKKCRHCESGEVEDECHFVAKCQFYRFGREKLITSLSKSCPNIKNLQNDHKSIFIYLMSVEGEASCEVGKYICESFDSRSDANEFIDKSPKAYTTRVGRTVKLPKKLNL